MCVRVGAGGSVGGVQAAGGGQGLGGLGGTAEPQEGCYVGVVLERSQNDVQLHPLENTGSRVRG